MIQEARGGVVSDIDIDQTIAIKIAGNYTETIIAIRIGHSRFYRNVLEGAVAIVMEESIARPRQTSGTTLNGNALVLTRPSLSKLR